jgi:hypothetical protein
LIPASLDGPSVVADLVAPLMDPTAAAPVALTAEEYSRFCERHFQDPTLS